MKTTEEISKMIKTKKLNLSFWQRLDYFRSIYVVLISGMMLLLPLLKFDLITPFLVISAITALITLGLLFRLRSGLLFKEIRTNLSQNENYIKIRNTFEAMNVEVDYAGMNWLVGRANKLLQYSGEQISIINTDGRIYVNSISPKGKLQFRTNKQNIEIFEQYFYLE